jgi:hypothetical protein
MSESVRVVFGLLANVPDGEVPPSWGEVMEGDDRPALAVAWSSIRELSGAEDCCVVCPDLYVDDVENILTELPEDNLLMEPSLRGYDGADVQYRGDLASLALAARFAMEKGAVLAAMPPTIKLANQDTAMPLVRTAAAFAMDGRIIHLGAQIIVAKPDVLALAMPKGLEAIVNGQEADWTKLPTLGLNYLQRSEHFLTLI